MDIVDQFYQIFRGRKDAVGTWAGGRRQSFNSDGEGTPLRASKELFEKHLTSVDPADWIGIYPLGVDACTWGCVDIDGKDFRTDEEGVWDWDRMFDLADTLCTLMRVKGVDGFTERTKNGIHVWVFPDNPTVPARAMRRALLAVCKAADYAPKEVNPKAEHLEKGKIGNYVRLPYYAALSDDGWQQPDRYFYDWSDPTRPRWDIEAFLRLVGFTGTDELEALAKLWTPPKRAVSVDTTVGLDADLSKLNGLGYTIWRDGPLPGSDRSGTLSHLAHLCQESGLTAQEGFTVVKSADARWGKFQPEGRDDADEQLQAIVERAYT